MKKLLWTIFLVLSCIANANTPKLKINNLSAKNCDEAITIMSEFSFSIGAIEQKKLWYKEKINIFYNILDRLKSSKNPQAKVGGLTRLEAETQITALNDYIEERSPKYYDQVQELLRTQIKDKCQFNL